jgi:hypothetical protein
MRAGPESDIRIRDDLSVHIFAVQKPLFTSRLYFQNDVVQLLHLAAFWFGMTRNMIFDLLLYVHELLDRIAIR